MQAHAPAKLVLLRRAEWPAAVSSDTRRGSRSARVGSQLLVRISVQLHHLAPISVDLQLLVPRTRGVAQVARGAPVLRRQAPPRERDLPYVCRHAISPHAARVHGRAGGVASRGGGAFSVPPVARQPTVLVLTTCYLLHPTSCGVSPWSCYLLLTTHLLWRQAVVPAVLCVVQCARRPNLVRSEQRPPLLGRESQGRGEPRSEWRVRRVERREPGESAPGGRRVESQEPCEPGAWSARCRRPPGLSGALSSTHLSSTPHLVLAKQLHFFVRFSGQVAAAKRSSVVCFACFGSCGAAATAACASLAAGRATTSLCTTSFAGAAGSARPTPVAPLHLVAAPVALPLVARVAPVGVAPPALV
eukprot:scaffold89075_cov58-Phaeocystis_antarctica.AAC.3